MFTEDEIYHLQSNTLNTFTEDEIYHLQSNTLNGWLESDSDHCAFCQPMQYRRMVRLKACGTINMGGRAYRSAQSIFMLFY